MISIEIGLVLFMGVSGTVMLFEIIDYDIVRRVLVFLYWVLIILGICECIKKDSDANMLRLNVKETLESSYPDSTDYKDQTFVYDGKKYSYDYNNETNTLTVFDGTGTIVNSIPIDSDGKDTSNSKTTPSETETESETVDNSTESSVTDSTTVSESNESTLAEKIKNKIIDRYPDAVITNFDVVSLSGSFTAEGNSYEFSWTDDMLEVDDVNDSDNVVFYKVVTN